MCVYVTQKSDVRHIVDNKVQALNLCQFKLHKSSLECKHKINARAQQKKRNPFETHCIEHIMSNPCLLHTHFLDASTVHFRFNKRASFMSISCETKHKDAKNTPHGLEQNKRTYLWHSLSIVHVRSGYITLFTTKNDGSSFTFLLYILHNFNW